MEHVLEQDFKESVCSASIVQPKKILREKTNNSLSSIIIFLIYGHFAQMEHRSDSNDIRHTLKKNGVLCLTDMDHPIEKREYIQKGICRYTDRQKHKTLAALRMRLKCNYEKNKFSLV